MTQKLFHWPQNQPLKFIPKLIWGFGFLLLEQVIQFIYLLFAANFKHHPLIIWVLLALVCVFMIWLMNNLLNLKNPQNPLPETSNKPYRLTKKQLWLIPFSVLGGYWLILLSNITIMKLAHLQQFKSSNNQLGLNSYANTSYGIFFLAILAVLIAPVIEEFVFRKLIITSADKTKRLIQCLISWILFIVLHLMANIFAPVTATYWIYLLAYFISYGVISGILTFTYYRYNSYEYNIIIHSVWNALSFIFIII